jgi:hypothetical protein
MPKTGFGFVRSLAFIVVLDVLPWLFLVLSCAIFPVVCRRRCYTVATLLPGDVWVFASYGLPLTISGVSKLFESLRKKTGIEDKRVSPHQCRRYMATMQLAAGRSPLDVQRQMGHTTLTMTNHYASLDIQYLKRSHDAYSPLRVKQESVNRQGIGTGYWEEE